MLPIGRGKNNEIQENSFFSTGELKRCQVHFFIHCPSSAILKSVGLICQRRKAHGALATDCLLLREFPETPTILPIISGKNKQIQEKL
jgi:hypothetical protein